MSSIFLENSSATSPLAIFDQIARKSAAQRPDDQTFTQYLQAADRPDRPEPRESAPSRSNRDDDPTIRSRASDEGRSEYEPPERTPAAEQVDEPADAASTSQEDAAQQNPTPVEQKDDSETSTDESAENPSTASDAPIAAVEPVVPGLETPVTPIDETLTIDPSINQTVPVAEPTSDTVEVDPLTVATESTSTDTKSATVKTIDATATVAVPAAEATQPKLQSSTQTTAASTVATTTAPEITTTAVQTALPTVDTQSAPQSTDFQSAPAQVEQKVDPLAVPAKALDESRPNASVQPLEQTQQPVETAIQQSTQVVQSGLANQQATSGPQPVDPKSSGRGRSEATAVVRQVDIPVATSETLLPETLVESTDKRGSESATASQQDPLPAIGDPARAPGSSTTNGQGSIASRLSQHLSGTTENQVDQGPRLSTADRKQFVQRVARAFQAAQARGGEVRMRLSPPELGSLKVELKIEGNNMMARLETDNSAARTILVDQLPALRDRLAQHGISIESFEVDVADRQPNQMDEGQQEQQSSRQESDNEASLQSDGVTEETEDPLIPISSGEDGRLNVIV